jgi:integrase
VSVRKRITVGGSIAWLVDYRDSAGARRARQFATKREADAFHARARTEVAAGIHTADSASITVAAAADLWLAHCEQRHLEKGTLANYREQLRLHIAPYLGGIKLTKLTVPVIHAYRDRLLEDGRSPEMARRALNSLSALISEAQARGLVATNVVRAVGRKARGGHAERRPVMPNREELRTIIAATGNANIPAQARPLILTALLAGLRASELRGLTWANVDLKQSLLHVRQRADCFHTMGQPKSKAGTRTIPMSPLLLNTLKTWRLACPRSELDLVFPSGRGTVQLYGTMLRGFWRVQIAAGVTVVRDGEPVAKYSLHALRHACASLLIEQGLSPKRIQVLMGHASIQMTFDVYGHLFPDESDSAAMTAVAAKLVGDSG